MKGLKIFLPEVIRRNELILVSWLVLSVAIVSTFLFLIPSISNGLTIRRESASLSRRLSVLQKKESVLQTIDPQRYKQSYGKIRRILPESKDIVSILTTFDTLQQTTGISFTRTDFQLGSVSTQSASVQKRHSSGAYSLPVEFETVGDMHQTVQLLDSLGAFTGRFITVQNIAWEFFPDDTVRTDVKGEAYFYPFPETIGSIDSTLPQLTAAHEEFIATIEERIPSFSPVESAEPDTPVGKKDLFF